MDSSGPTSGVTQEDIQELFRQFDQPSKPATTAQIAECLSAPQQSVRRRLQKLADCGEIQSTQLNDSTRVWWQPADRRSDDPEENTDQFRMFVSAVKDYAIFRLDPDGTIASWNEGAKRIKGYDAEEIIGEHFSTFYTEEDRAEDVPEQNLQRAESEGRVEDEGWRVRNDGSQFWANVTITAIRDDDGDLQGFTKVTRDMTERREYERQLETQAERLEHQRDDLKEELDDIFERVDDAFYALDDEFRFEYVNERAEEYLGKPAGELLGKHIEDALEIEEDPLLGEFELALETQEQRNFEHYSNLLDIWEVIRIYPSESGLSVYFRDITERKRREQRLEELVERLEESNERLEQFAYAASHDLQEPLRMVSSYLQLIEQRYADDFDEDGREFLEFAIDGADRMREMIEALLAYSRIETQGDPFEPVDLDEVLGDVLTDLQLKIEEHDADITVDELPTVEGDDNQLQQLFQNLLDNAIEYSGEEPPRVYVSAERAGTRWRISVRDEGIGIDPEGQDRIFEVFQRLHTRDEYAGTGIGLALCKRIVERHGGDITVDSDPGEGTTFTVTLQAPDNN